MKFAYADPPYFGCCRLYQHHHPDGLCWDELSTHAALIARLVEEYPDGWVLSASSVSLRAILPLCPPDVRVAAWEKSFCAFKKGVRPAYAWEPVIFWRGRNPNAGHSHAPPLKGGKQNTPKDFIVESITLRKGLTGAKPERVCEWILDLLNFKPRRHMRGLVSGHRCIGPRRDESGAQPDKRGMTHRHCCIVVGTWMLRDWHLYRYTQHRSVKRPDTVQWQMWDRVL